MNRLQVITEDVPVTPRRGRYRKTAADVVVIWRGFVVYIPMGFFFDGASLPFVLWWWVHPWTWWVVLGACVHDYTYRNRMFTRLECDLMFRAILIHKAKQSRWRWLRYRRINQARIMYRAVRTFGAAAVNADW